MDAQLFSTRELSFLKWSISSCFLDMNNNVIVVYLTDMLLASFLYDICHMACTAVVVIFKKKNVR